MKLELAIFDLDGVLVDTAKYHYQAWKRLAAELGFHFSEEHNERLKGVSRMRSLEILLEVGGLEKSLAEKEQLAEKKNRWYVEYISAMDESEILPGALEFLQEVKAEGVQIALGSASKNARLILDRLHLTGYFDFIVDGTLVSKAKPDPEVFSLAAQVLKVAPEKCVVFEDAAAGIEAGRRAGMFTVGVGSSQILHEANIVIPSLDQASFKSLTRQLPEHP
ncbi:MAG TPA: beta-phosphoglucomutase [Firmicutes bacterium]|jgi:beta-phosphoglucomutase|nr:MAG: beta-phosphoglucomutase [Peptococcaceae bacterium 1109]HHT72767.1 beta-phosphoglucomutase [Bacillota bacterium]